MKLTIKRSKWLRGEGSDKSRLLRPSDGKMCCVGMLGKACGVPMEDLKDKGAPTDKNGPPSKLWPAWTLEKSLYHSGLTETQSIAELFSVNDSEQHTWHYRERRIKEIMGEHGVTVRFVP